MDFLLVLSAALAAYQLVPQLEDASSSAPSTGRVLLRYWRQRARRLLPAYGATLLLMWVGLGPADVAPEVAAARGFAFGQCPRGLALNLLFASNARGLFACGGWSGAETQQDGMQLCVRAVRMLGLCTVPTRSRSSNNPLIHALVPRRRPLVEHSASGPVLHCISPHAGRAAPGGARL